MNLITFNEYKKYKDKILFIVDVQEDFKKWFKLDEEVYIEEINKLANKFDKVFQIYDINNADKPSYQFKNNVTIPKQYGGELTRDMMYLFEPSVQEELELKFDSFFDVYDNYTDKYGNMYIYVGHKHDWFIINDEFLDLLNRIKDIHNEVTLVGGAEEECLHDVVVALELFGIKYKKNRDLIY